MSNDKEIVFCKDHIHSGEIIAHLKHITREFSDGFDFLSRYKKSVSIFGSSMSDKDGEMYKKAEELSARIVKEIGYAVITGGGPGIMEAANKGAYEAGGVSLGLNVSLPHERTTNAYTTKSIKFSYFFSRKTMLVFAAETFVFFPGGYGTFDELFNILTLIQTGKIPRVPIILFGSDYWNHLGQFLREQTCNRYKAISNSDLEYFEITDSLDRVIEVIKKASVSEWWRNIN